MKRCPEIDELAQIQARRSDRAHKDASARRDRSAAPPDLVHETPLHDLRPPQLVALRYQLEDRLGAAGSVTGQQLERLRLGLCGPPPDGAAVDKQARLRVDSTVMYKLLSGKALLGQRTLVGGEVDVLLGPAVMIPVTSDPVYFGFNVGLGFRAYLSRMFSARLEVREYETFIFKPLRAVA